MNKQDTASKVIDRLTAKVAGLIRENAILSVMVEEQNDEIKILTAKQAEENSVTKEE